MNIEANFKPSKGLALIQNWDSSAIPLSTNKYIGKRRWAKLMFCTSCINGSEVTLIELCRCNIYADKRVLRINVFQGLIRLLGCIRIGKLVSSPNEVVMCQK